MEFDKRLWQARWAGDEQAVRRVAERLGVAAGELGDVVLQENLFEAQLTAIAAEGLAEGGISNALSSVHKEVDARLRTATEQARQRDFLQAVSGRIEKRLKDLRRQLEFKERKRQSARRTAEGDPLLPAPATELFVEQRRDQQQRDRFPGGRFWRIVHHPHGLELRSYVATRSWVRPEVIRVAMSKRGFTEVELGQRTTILRVEGESVAVHSDSRVHCVARELSSDAIVAMLQEISASIDHLWVAE